MNRKTKIVATIGPATETKEMLSKIINTGVNVCRINFSHGTHEAHKKVIDNIREINQEQGLFTAILADLQGPKIRVGKIKDNGVDIKNGDEIIISHMEHHSNIVPWQMVCEKTGAKLKIIPINDAGEILIEEYKKLLDERNEPAKNVKQNLEELNEKFDDLREELNETIEDYNS